LLKISTLRNQKQEVLAKMREPKINELQGASRLTLGFYNRLIRRIESTKPLAGSGVTISEKENGIEISSNGGGIGGGVGLQEITLNVCSNGSPATIVVYGPT
jgi:hypothetical protein